MQGQLERAEPTSPSRPTLTPVPVGPFVIRPHLVEPRAQPPVTLSLVVPTFNESENIREIIRQLTRLLEEPLGGAYSSSSWTTTAPTAPGR